MAELTLEEKKLALLEGLAGSAFPPVCQAGPVRDEMMAMDDGVKLHTWICLPQTDGPVPVIFTRTCYPHLEYKYRIYAKGFAERGFGFVWQYCRGREASEGTFVANVQERADTLCTARRLRSMPWCGRLGYYGHSYTAMIGWSMADAAEGLVDAMFLEEYGTDRFASVYQKGCFRHDIITAWSMENGSKPVTAAYEDYLASCRYRPQTEVDEALWGERNDTYREYVSSPSPEDPLWQEGWWKQLREIPSRTKIPVCVMSGWYDHHHGSSMRTWERLSEEAKAHSRLVVGGWNHSLRTCMPGRPAEHADTADLPRVLDWFDRTLRHPEQPVEPGCDYYVIGADRWIGRMPKTREVVFCPDASSELRGGAYVLREDVPEVTGRVSYIYDPENPVMSRGGDSLFKTKEQVGSLPVGPAGEREDVISFVSEPLEKPLTICGPVRAYLHVKSDAYDTAFAVKLSEIRDGTAYHIRESVTTIAADLPEGEHYIPRSECVVCVEMWDICYQLAKGSRLRMDITSSDFPEYHIHGNVAGPWAKMRVQKKAKQTILTGGEKASRLVIPAAEEEI
ncbi:MAG: CocE/NonD family hydrolase [Lachnospiraceae bacterium]|nr:CocE/NonD family hydrolase [Lachnospiraceae bacterium]